MAELPRPPAKVVRFHWEEVSHLDGRRRVPVVDVEVQADDGALRIALEVLPGSLCYAGLASPRVAVVAQATAQAFVDQRREKIGALFGA